MSPPINETDNIGETDNVGIISFTAHQRTATYCETDETTHCAPFFITT